MSNRTHNVYTYFNQPNEYLAKNFDIRLRSGIVRKCFGDLSDSHILDLGCGDGSISLQYQSQTNYLTLVDISENMLLEAQKKIKPQFLNNVSLVNSSIEAFKTPAKYDYIIGIGILAHVDSVESAIKNIASLMKKKSKCILQLTNSSNLISKFLFLYNHLLDKYRKNIFYPRNKTSLKNIISLSDVYGLTVLSIHQYSLMLPGLVTVLPNELLYLYHQIVYENKYLSKLGTDFLIELEKNDSN